MIVIVLSIILFISFYVFKVCNEQNFILTFCSGKEYMYVFFSSSKIYIYIHFIPDVYITRR